jgi:hypothetical protein
MMVGIEGGRVVEVPLEEVVERKHREVDLSLLHLAWQISG